MLSDNGEKLDYCKILGRNEKMDEELYGKDKGYGLLKHKISVKS
jgi:hypothetical protein